MKKYEEFRQAPENKVGFKERAYMDSLTGLGLIYEAYQASTGKKNNPSEGEQAFLKLIGDRKVLENVIEGNYDFQSGFLDSFVGLGDLERMDKLEKYLNPL